MQLLRPSSFAEALHALAEPGAQAIAGGTALQLTWEAGAKKPETIVDVSALSELTGVSEQAEAIHIGALTTLSELMQNALIVEYLPLLARATRDVAGPSVRTMGKLGGQIGWGVGCLLPALLALDAQVILASERGDRKQLLADYLAGDGSPLISAIRVPKQTSAHWLWHKTGLRASFTPGIIAVAGVWAQQDKVFADLRLAAGSGATPPQRLSVINEALEGKTASSVDESMIAQAIQAPDDALRTGAYRKRVGAAALARGLRGLPMPNAQTEARLPTTVPAPQGERVLSRAAANGDWHIRADLDDKLSGVPVFLTDARSDDMLVGAILRAPHPHAKLHSIDTSKAEALLGVHAVVTHKDVPGDNAFGIVIQDQPALCSDVVRYEGDTVAAVAADSKEIAKAALDLIEVTYEPLPIVSDPVHALAPDAPALHEGGNLRKTVQNKVGDVEAAFANAAHVVEDLYVTPRQMHGFMETEGGVVEPTDNGGILVRVGGQHGGRDRTQLSRILGLPEDKIEVVTSPIGGGFGGRDELTVQPALALLALKAKRPVRLQLSRTESVKAGTKRNPFQIRMKTACDKQGKLLAQQVDAIADGGAYASLSVGVIETAMEHACGPYLVPNIDARGRLVATNNGTCGAFRGFGCNEMTFAVESQIERLAQMVGVDAITMRRQNIRQPGMPGYLGQKVAPTERLSAMLDSAAASPLWTLPQGLSQDGQSWLGTGMALCYQGNGLGTLPEDEGEIELALAADGKIEARYGLDEMGQGLVPAVASAVSTALGVAREDVRVVFGDTRATPDSGSTTASRGTYIVWKGAQLTAPGFSQTLLQAAAAKLQRTPDQLMLVPGGVGEAGTNSGDPLITIRELADHLTPDQRPIERQFCAYPKSDYTKGNARFLFISGVTLARVAVDRINGMVRVLDMAQHSASGPVLDVASYLGQMEGAASQGMGMTLTEHVLMEEGRAVTGNLDTYIMPSLADRPGTMATFALDELDEGDPYGPRGVGELGITGSAPAIGNAVARALSLRADAAWPNHLPLSPETLLNFMEG
ncbi:MAG: molybdopterin cofactor-binding domain-containing protein [Hyphomicrobiales bacterium]